MWPPSRLGSYCPPRPPLPFMGHPRVLIAPGVTAGDIQTHHIRKNNLPSSSHNKVIPWCPVGCLLPCPSVWSPPVGTPPEVGSREAGAEGPAGEGKGQLCPSIPPSWPPGSLGSRRPLSRWFRTGDRPAFRQREQQDMSQCTCGLTSQGDLREVL